MSTTTTIGTGPLAEQKPKELVYHEHSRTDPYYWLRERENPAVKAFLEKENEYTQAVISGQGAPELENELYEDMKSRWKETDTSLPRKKKGFWYYSRSVEGLDYRIYCRLPLDAAPTFDVDFAKALEADEDALLPALPQEQVMLDLNQLAKDEKLDFVSLGSYDVAPDKKTVAFTLDLSDGNETYTVLIKDLETGKEVQRIKGEIYDSIVSLDGVVYYFTMDEAHRPCKLHRHFVGQETSDKVMFHEADETFWPGSLDTTDDDQYLVFNSGHKITDEWHYLPVAEAKTGDFKCFHPRVRGLEYSIDHHESLLGTGVGGWILNHNGDGCTNFRLDFLPDTELTKSTDRTQWKPLMKYDPNTNIEGVGCFKDFVVLSVRQEGLASVLLVSLAQLQKGTTDPITVGDVTNVRSLMTFDDEATRAFDVVELAGGGDFDATDFRVSLDNMIVPNRVVRVTPKDQSVYILKKEVVRGYDSSKYACERLWCEVTESRCRKDDPETNLSTAADAKIMVPITVAYRKELLNRGENPCLLYAYGSYGASIDPYFSSARVSLLNSGFVYALASIRGGGEMGRIWRNAGRMEYKMNTFTDFIKCGEYMIESKWCHKDKLVACGRSAGGMLMGAVTWMKPSLWRTIVAGVPFVDCVTTMCDPTIPLTIPEWDEWGNPLEDKEAYHRILEYSPMDHVDETGKTVFPNMFVTSGLTDPRVAYWEPAAWVARLRTAWAASDAAADRRYLCHKCVIGAGHGGAAGRYKHLKETAAEYSFVLQSVGISKLNKFN